MTLLQHHVLALWLTAITTAALGLLAFLAEPRKRLNQVFGLYSLAIVWWAIGESLIVSGSRQSFVDVVAMFSWPWVTLIAPTFFHTVCLLVGRTNRITRCTIVASYVVTLFLVIAHVVFHLVIKHCSPIAYARFFIRLAPLGMASPLLFLILVNFSLLKLWRAFRQTTGSRRTQLRFLLVASLVGYLGGSPDWLLTFDKQIPLMSPFGIYCVPLYSLATTYAIFQHRLFDVHIVIRKSLAYSLLVSALTVGYFGSIYFWEQAFRTTFGYSSVGVSLVAFAVMALVFQPLKIGIQRAVDHLIFRAPQHAVAKRLEILEEKVRIGEQYKAVATMAAEIAHELKNPLTALQTFVEFLPERHQDPQFLQRFQAVASGELQRLRRVAQGLLDFSKPQAPQMAEVDLRAVLDDVLALTTPTLLKRAIVVETHYGHNGTTLIGDAGHLRQVFLNLVRNADQAMQPGGTLRISTNSQDGHLEAYVADTGCGISPSDVPHLFDPFFSKKAEGTGLGLSITREIIREHHGAIEVQSTPGQGTTMIVRLPAS